MLDDEPAGTAAQLEGGAAGGIEGDGAEVEALDGAAERLRLAGCRRAGDGLNRFERGGFGKTAEQERLDGELAGCLDTTTQRAERGDDSARGVEGGGLVGAEGGGDLFVGHGVMKSSKPRERRQRR